jgi:hypothetical protein
MITETFDKAKELLDRLNHIEKVLIYLKDVQASKHFITMMECGFVAHPKEEKITDSELTFVIEAYEKEKENLKQEFFLL